MEYFTVLQDGDVQDDGDDDDKLEPQENDNEEENESVSSVFVSKSVDIVPEEEFVEDSNKDSSEESDDKYVAANVRDSADLEIERDMIECLSLFSLTR